MRIDIRNINKKEGETFLVYGIDENHFVVEAYDEHDFLNKIEDGFDIAKQYVEALNKDPNHKVVKVSVFAKELKEL